MASKKKKLPPAFAANAKKARGKASAGMTAPGTAPAKGALGKTLTHPTGVVGTAKAKGVGAKKRAKKNRPFGM